MLSCKLLKQPRLQLLPKRWRPCPAWWWWWENSKWTRLMPQNMHCYDSPSRNISRAWHSITINVKTHRYHNQTSHNYRTIFFPIATCVSYWHIYANFTLHTEFPRGAAHQYMLITTAMQITLPYPMQITGPILHNGPPTTPPSFFLHYIISICHCYVMSYRCSSWIVPTCQHQLCVPKSMTKTDKRTQMNRYFFHFYLFFLAEILLSQISPRHIRTHI